MEAIREILAKNLRENRDRLNMSQPKLAELANLSTHYIASIETLRKFPTPVVLERLAKALGIPSHELFLAPPTPEKTLERLHHEAVADIENVVNEAVKRAITKQIRRLNKQEKLNRARRELEKPLTRRRKY